MRAPAALACAALAALAALPAPGLPAERARIEHRLTYDRAAGEWRVELTATGLADHAQDLLLVLDDWGEWTEVDSYHLVVERADPPLARDPERPHVLVPELPGRWDGELQLVYRLRTTERGSRAAARHGLLPTRAETWSALFTSNALVLPTAGGEELDATRALAVVPPPGWSVFSGWGGLSRAAQELVLEPGAHNTFVHVGVPVGAATRERDGVRVEVAQFVDGEDWSAETADLTLELLAAMARALDAPPPGPVRVVVTEPGGGGTRVEGGVAASMPYRWGDRIAPYSVQLWAHELFHVWLGGTITARTDDLQWFFEGFTDYLALWFAAAGGHVDRDWLAERLSELDAEQRANPTRQEVRFADRGRRWRGGDLEDLAYKGGCLLAFHLDAELRRRGRPGLLELVRDLGREEGGRFDHDTIERWLAARDLAGFRQARMVDMEHGDLAADLRELGFERARAPEPLAYVGLRLEQKDALFGRVVEVDPDGPAAAAGIRVGDRVTGFYPTRVDRPQVGEAVETRFRYALAWLEPGREDTYIGVERDGEELQCPLVPRAIEGGYREAWRVAERERVDAYLSFDPDRAPAGSAEAPR